VTKRVLFVSHAASRTGAPIVLLEILRWMRTNTETECSVLFWSGGSLLAEFQTLAQCRVLHPHSTNVSLTRQLWERLSLRPDDNDRQRGRLERTVRWSAQQIAAAVDERWMRQWRSCDLVYANSVGSARAMRALGPRSPLIAHVHESSYSLQHTESQADVAAITGGRHPIIAASRSVESTLIEDFGVPPSRLCVMNSFIRLPPPAVPTQVVESLRSSLGIPAGAFVVGGAGTIEWRKGPDLFVQLARRIAVLRPDTEIHFVWVGAESPSDPLERVRIDIDVTQSGASDRIHFVGAQSDPWPFHHLFDVFALTSRAEPLGLVAIEAAAIGRPVLCFAGAGGMPDFVTGGGGFIVPYLGLEEMALRVLELYDNPGLRRSLGEEAAEEVRRGYDAEMVVPRIGELILATAR
jgi:glycosyltransferase involved in cell wall biosynthesis